MPRDDYRTDLVATAVLPAPTGRTPPRLGLVARGDLSRMEVALAGNVPAPLRATLTLRGKDHARAGSCAPMPMRWIRSLLAGSGEAGTPIAFNLQADGTAAMRNCKAGSRGAISTATIQPSHVSLAEQVLTVQPLVIDVLDGRVTLHGHAEPAAIPTTPACGSRSTRAAWPGAAPTTRHARSSRRRRLRHRRQTRCVDGDRRRHVIARRPARPAAIRWSRRQRAHAAADR